ncbi:MAG TPA: MFS transporter [Bryobacteraceae bacterium]|nr:MFS transporter [Bryobacteraceae bacterium]
MSTAVSPLSFKEVLKIGGMRRLWMAQVVSVFGDFLAIFAIFSLISFRMKGNASEVSGVLIAYLLPFTFVSPVAGVFVDRWNVKRTMIASDLIRAVLVGFLVLATNVWHIYGILFVLSTVSSFFMPAQSVAIRTMVPREGLLSANALIQQAFYALQIISPAIAAAIVSAAGPGICFWVDSASFVASALFLSGIVVKRDTAPQLKNLGSIVHEMNAGVKFILTHASISVVVLSITAGMFAVRCFGALVAVFVRDVLAAGNGLFGILSSLVGVGMIIGSQFTRRLAMTRSKAHMVIGGLVGMGVGISIVAAVPWVPFAIAGMLIMGLFAAFIVIPSQALMQEETPPELLGRVGGSMMSVMMASQIAALCLAGPVAQIMGIRNLYFASAAFLALIAVAGHYRLGRNVAIQRAAVNA